MSRVGRKPIPIPDKVKVEVKNGAMVVSGPMGTLEQPLPQGVTIAIEDGVAVVGAPPPDRHNSGFRGLVRALLANMIEGVVKGYEKTLEINGVGYKAELKGEICTFTLGYSHSIDVKVPQGIKLEVDKQQTTVKVKGIDKQAVGQLAAHIRSLKIPEPYKAKGVKYADEIVRRKVGKAGAK